MTEVRCDWGDERDDERCCGDEGTDYCGYHRSPRHTHMRDEMYWEQYEEQEYHRRAWEWGDDQGAEVTEVTGDTICCGFVAYLGWWTLYVVVFICFSRTTMQILGTHLLVCILSIRQKKHIKKMWYNGHIDGDGLSIRKLA